MADVQCGEQSATAPALLSVAEFLSGLANPGWQICGVGGTIYHSSSPGELLLGYASPGWQMRGVGDNLPQLQCC